MEKKKQIKLYNVIFPFWMLVYFPPIILFAMPANWLIDFIVLRMSMKKIGIENYKEYSKKAIWKTWIAGFVADFIGGLLMIAVLVIDSIVDYTSSFGQWWYEKMTNAVMLNPFETFPAFVWVLLCTFVSSWLIYVLNKKWCLKKIDIDEQYKKKIALALAIFTAPYLFFLPTMWFAM